MSFTIPTKKYTYEEFINRILIVELPQYNTFKIACYLTNINKWENELFSLTDIFIRHNFIVENLGEIKRLIKTVYNNNLQENRNVIIYAYLDPVTKILLCFTDEKNEDIYNVFSSLLKYQEGIYYLFLNSSAFFYVSRKIIEKDSRNECIYFSARHLPSYVTKGKIRPDKKRTIVYYATDGDGIETLHEMRINYGVLPRVMRFRIYDVGVFDIKNTGLFTVYRTSNDEMAREELLKLINLTLEYVLIQKQILEKSEYKLIPVRTKEKIFNIPTINPWIIKFNDILEDKNMPELINVLNQNNFPIYNYISEIGDSFHVSGTIIDAQKNKLFSIDIVNNEICVSPFEKVTFDSFLRFYEVIVENFDPEATIEELKK